MRKVKFLLQLIAQISKETSKNKGLIFLDIINCIKKYNASLKDYSLFQMHKLNEFERKTILTEGKNRFYIKKYNNLKTKSIHIKDLTKFCQKKGKISENKSFLNLHPSSTNTIKTVTLLGKVAFAILEIGNNNHKTVKYNRDGLVAFINKETGIIEFPACDKENNSYEYHPITNQKIINLQIPNWNDLVNLCEEASLEIPTVGYVEWTICVEKQSILSINSFPTYYLYQLPLHMKNKIGILPKLEEIERKIEK